jgi:hypothetical protein
VVDVYPEQDHGRFAIGTYSRLVGPT